MNTTYDSLVKDFCVYLDSLKGLSEYTVKGYRADLESLSQFMNADGVVSVTDFSRDHLRRYLSWLLECGYERSSVARKQSVLRQFFKWLYLEGHIESDPIPRRMPMKKDKTLPVFLTREEIERLIYAATENEAFPLISVRDVALIELIYGSGLRVSEACRVNIADLNIDEMTILVTGKGSKQRIALFGERARLSLDTYIKDARPLLVGKESEAIQPLFLSRNGGRLSVRSIQDRIKRYGRKSGLGSKVHTHSLRHSFATHILEGGGDIRVLQDLLGHETPDTTQIYTHVTGLQAKKSYNLAHPMSESEENHDNDLNVSL